MKCTNTSFLMLHINMGYIFISGFQLYSMQWYIHNISVLKRSQHLGREHLHSIPINCLIVYVFWDINYFYFATTWVMPYELCRNHFHFNSQSFCDIQMPQTQMRGGGWGQDPLYNESVIICQKGRNLCQLLTLKMGRTTI